MKNMFVIYGMWADVMRLGLLPEEAIKEDVEWWQEHQKEIDFTFKVLAGLNLATWREPDEDGVQNIAPSNALKKLLRYKRPHYIGRSARDKHLQALFAESLAKGAKATGAK
jgi:hypothetical protein